MFGTICYYSQLIGKLLNVKSLTIYIRVRKGRNEEAQVRIWKYHPPADRGRFLLTRVGAYSQGKVLEMLPNLKRSEKERNEEVQQLGATLCSILQHQDWPDNTKMSIIIIASIVIDTFIFCLLCVLKFWKYIDAWRGSVPPVYCDISQDKSILLSEAPLPSYSISVLHSMITLKVKPHSPHNVILTHFMSFTCPLTFNGEFTQFTEV